MSEQQPRRRAGPYADAYLALWDAGWRGVIPLPYKRKMPPPDDLTGSRGGWPSFPDVQAWSEGEPANVALRLPDNVVGIDVDDYLGKLGAATMRLASEQLGPLPPTWRSTSREHSTSGIYLYRVPESLVWPGQVGRDVEFIQCRHRYMVAPPSLHPNGGTYRWVRADGTTSIAPPTLDDLAHLPQPWIEAYAMKAPLPGEAVAPLDTAAVHALLDNAAPGPLCRRMQQALTVSLDEVQHGGRHSAALRATLRLVGLAGEGHAGVLVALDAFLPAWQQACSDSQRGGARSEQTMRREWDDLLGGACARVAGAGLTAYDPCEYPFSGILSPGPSAAALRVQGEALLARESASQAQADSQDTHELGGAQIDAQRLTAAGIDPSLLLVVEQQVTREQVYGLAREIVGERKAAREQVPLVSLPSVRDDLALPVEPIAFKVDEVLPVGANVLLTSAFKAGKTTMVNHLARCLLTGAAFLGRFAVRDGLRVALWNYEVSPGMYRRWLADALAGVADEALERLVLLNLRGIAGPSLITPSGQQQAVDWLRANRIDLWIVDPFARAFGGESENDNALVGRWLESLDVIKERSGVRELLLVTHTGRGDSAQERARGATRLDDWCDVRWLILRGEDDQRFFKASGRDVEVGEGALDYDAASRSLRLSTGTRASRPDGEIQAAVLAIVRADNGVNLSTLRESTRAKVGQASNARVDKAIAGLRSQSLIFVTESKHGGPTQHWSAPQIEAGP